MSTLRSERGAALVELALAVPMLIIVLIGIADFARVFYHAAGLTNAARAGAQYGAQSVVWSAASTQAAAESASPTTQPYTVSTPARTCGCMDDAGANFAAVACSASCASGRHMAVFVTVSASKTFSSVMTFGTFPPPVNLVRGVTMRAQ